MAAKLKVYRTAIGFHDAYVAAPSQKAALAAWGTDKPLFARRAAEVVTDPALTAEPLGRPGEVVKRLRGTEAEQIAALSSDGPTRKDAVAPGKPAATKPTVKLKPSRAKLEVAERAADEAEEQHAAERTDIDARERALREERKDLEKRQRYETATLTKEREAAREAYDQALREWQG